MTKPNNEQSPAAGDALDLTLAQKYEDACILSNADAQDAARWRAYAAQFPEISAAFLAVHGDDPLPTLPTIKGASITGGYVVVTPAGWDTNKARKVRDAILRLFPVDPTHTPRPSATAAGDALDAARWRFVRRKLCLTGNGDGTCAMQAINLPASIPGWPEPGSAVAEFCDAAIDAAIAAQRKGDA